MLEDWLSIMAILLAYASLLLCRCRSKTGNDNAIILLVLAASVVPVFLSGHSAVVVLAAFSFTIFWYFVAYYERRLRTIGRIANELSEMQACKLLLLLAGDIAELLCQGGFRFYSENMGQQAFWAFAGNPDSPIPRKKCHETLCHALRFIHTDTMRKCGNPPRSHCLSLLLEHINRNVIFYMTTARSGNMADIHNAARKNLSSLFNIYSRNFHLQEGNSADWSNSAAFAELRQQFEAELIKFPV